MIKISFSFSSTFFFLVSVLLLPLLLHGHITRTIRIAAVAPLTNNVKLALDIPTTLRGYRFAVDYANSQNEGKGVLLGGQTNVYIKFNYTEWDDQANETTAKNILEDLTANDKVDFIVGVHTTRAILEGGVCERNKKILVVCCAGPNSIYVPYDRQYVFGIHGDSSTYSENFIRGAHLRGAHKIGIVYLSSADFAVSLGASSINYAKTSRYTDYYSYSYDPVPNPQDFYPTFKRIADDLIEKKIDIFVGATLGDDGDVWFETWRANRYPLKGMFLTAIPGDPKWVASKKSADVRYLSTGTQWDSSLISSDDYHGTNEEFVEKFLQWSNNTVSPGYMAASATAAIYTIIQAINQTFDKDVLIENNDNNYYNISDGKGKIKRVVKISEMFNSTNYDRVLTSFGKLQLNCFFGVIEFNRYRRNRKTVVTTQIQISNPSKSLVVFPIESSPIDFVYPIPGTQYVPWSHPTAIISGVLTSLFIVTSLLIGFALFFFRRLAKITSPLFNVLSIFGACMSASSVYLWPGIPTDGTCLAIPWLFVIGWTIMIGCLLAKTWRIRIIVMGIQNFEHKFVKDREVLTWVGGLLIIDIILLSVFSGISNTRQRYASCESDYAFPFTIIFIILFGLKVVVLGVISFQARTFRNSLNDAVILMFVGFYLGIMMVIFACLVFFVDWTNQPEVKLMIVMAATLTLTTGVVGVLYIPVLFTILFMPGGGSLSHKIKVATGSPITKPPESNGGTIVSQNYE